MSQQTGKSKELYQKAGFNIGGYLSTGNTNTINTKLGNMLFTASSVKEVIGVLSGTTNTEKTINSKLNEILNTINYVNSDVKRQKYQNLYFKGFDTIVRDVKAILSITKSESEASDIKNDSKKVANETNLKTISSSTLADGEIKYVENNKQFYSFDKNDNTGIAPDDKETSGAPGTWNAVTLSATTKIYRALLNQSETNAPTAIVLENTLGGTITWTRGSVGSYTGTLTGAFTLNKTFILIQSDGNSEFQYAGPNDVDSIYVQTVRVDAQRLTADGTQVFQDAGLINTPIEIRVYL